MNGSLPVFFSTMPSTVVNGPLTQAVARRVRRHRAVGHAQRRVGVRVDRLALRLLEGDHGRHVLRDHAFQVAVDFLAAVFQRHARRRAGLHGQRDERVVRGAEGVRRPCRSRPGAWRCRPARVLRYIAGSAASAPAAARRGPAGASSPSAWRSAAARPCSAPRRRWHERLLEPRQARLDERQVAFLVAAFALCVRLLALEGQAIQGARALEQVAVGRFDPGGLPRRCSAMSAAITASSSASRFFDAPAWLLAARRGTRRPARP